MRRAHAVVNGTGIAELINNLAAFRQEKRPVAVVGLSENFKAIFEMMGVTRFATLHDTKAQALEKMAAGAGQMEACVGGRSRNRIGGLPDRAEGSIPRVGTTPRATPKA